MPILTAKHTAEFSKLYNTNILDEIDGGFGIIIMNPPYLSTSKDKLIGSEI